MAEKHQGSSLQPLICPVHLWDACYPRPRGPRVPGDCIFMSCLGIGTFPSLVPVGQFPKKSHSYSFWDLPYLISKTQGVPLSPCLESSPLFWPPAPCFSYSSCTATRLRSFSLLRTEGRKAKVFTQYLFSARARKHKILLPPWNWERKKWENKCRLVRQ